MRCIFCDKIISRRDKTCPHCGEKDPHISSYDDNDETTENSNRTKKSMNKIKNFTYLILIILFAYIIRVSTTEQKAIFALYTKNHEMVKDSIRYINLNEEYKDECKSFKTACEKMFKKSCEEEFERIRAQYHIPNHSLILYYSRPGYVGYVDYYAKCEIQGF